MSTLIGDFQDEQRAVAEAAGVLGRHIPPATGMSVSNWRKCALASFGRTPSADPGVGEVLQAVGELNGQQYEIQERTRSGPLVSRFYGSPRSTWDSFMNEPQQLVRLTNDPANLTRPSAWRNLDGAVIRIEPPAQGGF